MLCVGVGMCAWGRLKRHWTNRTLVEDFTVRTLNVRLQCSHIRVHNIAMYTSVREINTQSLERDPYTHVQLNCVKWTHCNGLLRFLIAFWKCASFFPIFICKKEDHEEEEEENWNALEFEHLKDSWKGCPDWGENNRARRPYRGPEHSETLWLPALQKTPTRWILTSGPCGS